MLDQNNLFYPYQYEKNDKIILKYFQWIMKRLRWKKSIALNLINRDNLKTLKFCEYLEEH